MKPNDGWGSNVVFLQPMPKKVHFDAPNRIRELRTKAELTLDDLSSRIGMALGHLQRIEVGKRDLSLGWMNRIAKELGVLPADLLNPEDGGLKADERKLVSTVREVPEPLRKSYYALAESQQGYRGEPEVHSLDDRKTA